jgi:hypothetical protein
MMKRIQVLLESCLFNRYYNLTWICIFEFLEAFDFQHVCLIIIWKATSESLGGYHGLNVSSRNSHVET